MKPIKYLIGSAILGAYLAVAGCANDNIEKRIEKYHDSKQTELCKAGDYICGKVKSLEKNEHIVPDNVMEIYDSMRYNRKEKGIKGAYIPKNFKPAEQFKNGFLWKLMKEGNYSHNEAIRLVNLFITSGNILLKEELFSQDYLSCLTNKESGDVSNPNSLEFYLCHERMHREIDGLTKEEKSKIEDAFKKLNDLHDCKQTYEKETKTATLKCYHFLKKDFVAIYNYPIEMNGDEFLAYLAIGAYSNRVYEEFQKRFPDVYKTYLKLKEKARVE